MKSTFRIVRQFTASVRASRNMKSREQIDPKDYLTKSDFHSDVSSNQRNNLQQNHCGR